MRSPPVERRTHRPGGSHRIECCCGAVGDAAGTGTGHRNRQPRNPGGQLDIGVEVQAADDRGRERVGRVAQCRLAIGHRQWLDFALRGYGSRYVQRWNQAQLGNRHTGRTHDHFAVAGSVLALRTEGVDTRQIRCDAWLFAGHGQYTPSMTASPSKVATGRTALTESLSRPAGPGIRIAISRSRLFGMNMPLLMWFITT